MHDSVDHFKPQHCGVSNGFLLVSFLLIVAHPPFVRWRKISSHILKEVHFSIRSLSRNLALSCTSTRTKNRPSSTSTPNRTSSICAIPDRPRMTGNPFIIR